MTCAELLERYTDFRDGLITAPREVRRFERHLACCPACRRYDAAVRRGVRALQTVETIEPSPEFRRRLDARLAQERRALVQVPASAGIAAALFVAAALALLALEGVQRPPDAVYYVHGDEDVLKDEAIRALVDRVLDPGARDFNFDQRSASDLDPEVLDSLVNTPPLLAAARVVVLRGVEEVRKTSKVRQALVRYLQTPNPTTLLILVQGAGEPPDAELARSATTVAIEPLPAPRVHKWVAHRARQLQLTLEPDAAELLVQTVGNDLGALAGELAKLAAVVAGRTSGGGATREDVAALVGARPGQTLQDLIDAALERRAAAAARLIEPVLEQAGMTGVRILMALGTALLGTALRRAEP